MTMDELTQQQRHLRNVMRKVEEERLARRIAEIDAAQAYMRALKDGANVRNAEADWRFAQARYEVGDWMAETARADLMAINQLIMDTLEGTRSHDDH